MKPNDKIIEELTKRIELLEAQLKDSNDEWIEVDRQDVVDQFVPAGVFNNGIKSWHTEYIMKNIRTGELKRT